MRDVFRGPVNLLPRRKEELVADAFIRCGAAAVRDRVELNLADGFTDDRGEIHVQAVQEPLPCGVPGRREVIDRF